jgi:large subunit ribosomal protein L21|tara:strand:+ start:348 stop:662 length:315 start_codon:yes stop_codon:yes gene_type:complete
MYAIIRTGGRQYRVEEGDVLDVERITGNPGDVLKFDDVLLIGGEEGDTRVGTPTVEGAIVSAELVEQTRANKVLFFHFKNKTRQAKKRGHHQLMTRLQINQIKV